MPGEGQLLKSEQHRRWAGLARLRAGRSVVDPGVLPVPDLLHRSAAYAGHARRLHRQPSPDSEPGIPSPWRSWTMAAITSQTSKKAMGRNWMAASSAMPTMML